MKKFLSLSLLLFVGVLTAQIDHPKASPAAAVVQEVGFTTINIHYSRPAVRGRTIFGDLVPYGRIWRVGANESTKFTTDAEISVMGNKLPAATYALYAVPQENQWEIIFHKNSSHWGDGRAKYNAEEDAFRVNVELVQEAKFQENFIIYFDQLTNDSANMIWHWANTSVTIPLRFNTKATMEALIEEKLKSNPSAQTYYEVARYYVETQTNYERALDYLEKALKIDGDTYYFHRVKSLAEAALKNYEAAIVSAQKSLTLAEEQNKDEFVRMNQKNINLWKSKL